MITKDEIHDMVLLRRELLLTLNPMGEQTYRFFRIKKELDDMVKESEEEVCMVCIRTPFSPREEV